MKDILDANGTATAGNLTGASEGLGLNMISVERNQVPTLAAPKTWTPSPPFGHTEPQPRQQCIAYREHDDAARTSSYPATPFNTLSSKGWSESQGGAMQTDNQTCPDVKNEHGHPEYTARRPAYRGRPCRENPLDLSFPLENRKRTSRNNKGRTSSCSCPDVWACKNQRSDFERFTPATHGPGDHFEVPRLQPRQPHSRLHGWEDRRRHHCPRCSQLAQCVCPSPSGSPTEILRTTGNTELQPSACSSRRSSPAKEANLVVSLDHGRQCARYTPSDHLTPTNHSPGFSNVSHNNKNYSRDHHHERSTHHRPPSSHRSQNERNQSRDQGSHICGRGAVPKRYKRKRSGSTAIPRTPGTRHECTPETSCFSEDEGQCRTVIRKSHLERKYGLIPKDQMDGSFWGKRHSRCDNHSSSDIPLPKDSALMSEASGEEKEDLEAEFDIADGELPAFAYPPDRDYYITCLPPSQLGALSLANLSLPSVANTSELVDGSTPSMSWDHLTPDPSPILRDIAGPGPLPPGIRKISIYERWV
ncbi:uncharacterized protein LOC143041790 isoform X2 [Oratosquilla oratoria]|uniref:uncharacterized protein LOC143041790 isoform X2 n=1 Tax=Oratosquilla oratoria TaxID=337810 RepID=UPI003F75B936